MLLIAEIIIILVLVIGLIIVIIEDHKIKKSKIPKGTVKEYWNGRERRQAIRINASFVVKYSVKKKPYTKLNAHMKDLSHGGMRLLINEKLEEGVLLLLEFNIPDTTDAISTEGKVIWTEGEFSERDEAGRRIFQTGIQFINIKTADKEKLVSYIEKIAEKR